MLESVTALLFALAAPGTWAQCADENDPADYHLTSVCEAWLEGAPAYSATVRASLSQKPAAQQVAIVRINDKWHILIAGYRWDMDEGTTTTRRIERPIADEDALAIANLLSDRAFERLGKIPYYGRADLICMDGAMYELAHASRGRTITARQHSCAGETEINAIMSAFRKLALKYDPASEGMLYWLAE